MAPGLGGLGRLSGDGNGEAMIVAKGSTGTPALKTVSDAMGFLRQNNVRFVLAQFVDIHGVAKTKSVPVSHFQDILEEGAGFAGFALWGFGMEPHSPDDWSPVCGDQLALYNEILPEFKKYAAELLGISIDTAWSHEAYTKDRHLHFPLLADFEPKGEVAKKYGAYRAADGFCERALFVIDKKGMVFWSYCSPVLVNPGADGILEALEKLPK
jgi:peroxiredoxin